MRERLDRFVCDNVKCGLVIETPVRQGDSEFHVPKTWIELTRHFFWGVDRRFACCSACVIEVMVAYEAEKQAEEERKRNYDTERTNGMTQLVELYDR